MTKIHIHLHLFQPPLLLHISILWFSEVSLCTSMTTIRISMYQNSTVKSLIISVYNCEGNTLVLLWLHQERNSLIIHINASN